MHEPLSPSRLNIYSGTYSTQARRSIRLGGQSTALLRAALAWAAQGSMNGDGDTAKPAMAMYGEFRAARESAEQVNERKRCGEEYAHPCAYGH